MAAMCTPAQQASRGHVLMPAARLHGLVPQQPRIQPMSACSATRPGSSTFVTPPQRQAQPQSQSHSVPTRTHRKHSTHPSSAQPTDWRTQWSPGTASNPQPEPSPQTPSFTPSVQQPASMPAAFQARSAQSQNHPSARAAARASPQEGPHSSLPAALLQLLQHASVLDQGRTQAVSQWLAHARRLPGFLPRLRLGRHNAKLPCLSRVVIVEGFADCAVVHQAVNALVYVCDGSSVKSEAAAREVALLQRWPWGSIILTDPDAPGRELRMFLDDLMVQRPRSQGRPLPPVLHSFVAVEHATALQATTWHEEGNTGVENAAPERVAASLEQARTSFPSTRKEFSVQELQERGLANTYDAKLTHGAKLRRKLVCDRLGIDPCTGKSLANVLNRFFTREELEAAVAALPPA